MFHKFCKHLVEPQTIHLLERGPFFAVSVLPNVQMIQESITQSHIPAKSGRAGGRKFQHYSLKLLLFLLSSLFVLASLCLSLSQPLSLSLCTPLSPSLPPSLSLSLCLSLSLVVWWGGFPCPTQTLEAIHSDPCFPFWMG